MKPTYHPSQVRDEVGQPGITNGQHRRKRIKGAMRNGSTQATRGIAATGGVVVYRDGRVFEMVRTREPKERKRSIKRFDHTKSYIPETAKFNHGHNYAAE